MAKKYTATVVVDGKADGAVNSLKITRQQLDKLGKSTKGAKSQAGALTKSFGAMKTQLLALAPAIGAAGIIAIGKRSLDAADQIQKLSSRIGASTEALSEYRHVAELSGVPFEALTMSWQRQTRRLSEAAAGYGEARGALEELGLSAKDLNKLKPEEQFERLADALNSVENQQDRVRLAMKFWDSEGVKLLQVTNQGAEAMRGMREEAVALGKSISQDQADAAAKANDEMTKLSAAWGGAAETLTLQLAPALTQIISKMNEAAREAGLFAAIGVGINEAFKTMLHGVPPTIDESRQKVLELRAEIRELTDNMKPHVAVMEQLKKQNMESHPAYKIHADRVEEYRKRVVEATKEIQKIVEVKEEDNTQTEKANKLTEKSTKLTKDKTKADKDALKTENDRAKALESVIHGLDESARATEDFTNKYDILHGAVMRGDITFERYEELISMLTNGHKELSNEVSETSDVMADLFDDAFRSMLDGSLDSFESFSDAFLSGIRGMLADAAQEMITRPLAMNISAIVSGQPGTGSPMAGVQSMFGGQQIGTGIQNVGSFLGTDLFSGAGGVANWQYGLAGLGGGLLGGAIGGETGSMLGGLGSTIGMATPLGPLGAALGALAGGALGKVFGGDDTAYATWTTRKEREGFEDDVAVQSAFGYLGMADIGSKNIKAKDYKEALQAVAAIDNMIAEAFGPDTASAIADRLDGWTEQDRKADDFAERMALRFKIIMDEVDFAFTDIVEAGSGLQDMATRLVALVQISDYIDADILADRMDAVALASMTMRDGLMASQDAMMELVSGYDMSTDATTELAGALQSRYALELQYLDQIMSVQQGLTSMLTGSMEAIQLSVMDTSEQYDYYTDRAETLADALETMTDPTRIQETAQQIDQLTSRAYGLLDATQQQEVSNEFVDFLGGVLETSQERLKAAEQEAVETGQILRDALLEAITSGGANFGSQMQTSAAVLNSAAGRIASVIAAAGGEIG